MAATFLELFKARLDGAEPALVKGVPQQGIANRCSLSPFQPRPFYDFPSLCGLYLNYFKFSYLNMTNFCKLFHFDLNFET